MTAAQTVEAELRSVVAEAVGHLRIVSEGITPLQRDPVKALVNEAQRALEVAFSLADRLP